MSIAPNTRTPTWVALQNPTLELANQIAGTDFVPTALRNNPAAITAAILYGNEVGLGPMQSLANISVINGRPTLAAETQRALILAAGHDLWIEELTVSKCTMAGRRVDSDATSRVTWTLDDARRAGLNGRQAWRQYPRQMLLARASAELARAVFPDAIGGLAATEEFQDGPSESAAEPEPTGKRTRKRANVTAPATTPEAPTPPEPEGPPLPGDAPRRPTEDSPPPAAPAGDDGEALPLLSRRQQNDIFRRVGALDFTTRQERLDYLSHIVGRPVKSSSELTMAEASQVIDHLDQLDRDWPAPPTQGELPEDY